MATFYVKQNDAKQLMTMYLKNADDTAIDLTDASQVHLHVGKKGDVVSKIVDAACVIVAPKTAGKVRYTWVAANTIEAGEYDGEVEIRWPDSTIRTVPSKGNFKVVIGPEVA
jgi:hypothetical protein